MRYSGRRRRRCSRRPSRRWPRLHRFARVRPRVLARLHRPGRLGDAPSDSSSAASCVPSGKIAGVADHHFRPAHDGAPENQVALTGKARPDDAESPAGSSAPCSSASRSRSAGRRASGPSWPPFSPLLGSQDPRLGGRAPARRSTRWGWRPVLAHVAGGQSVLFGVPSASARTTKRSKSPPASSSSSLGR